MPRPTNVNDRYRTLGTERVVSMSQLKRLPTGKEMNEIAEVELKLAGRKTARDRRFNKGHVLNVLKAMRHIRKCRRRMKCPRSVPKKVLDTVERLRLI
jgi:hypothetical protein